MVVIEKCFSDILEDEGADGVLGVFIGEKLPLSDVPVAHNKEDEGEVCGLGAIGFVKFFVKGLDSYVGERGSDDVFDELGNLD